MSVKKYYNVLQCTAVSILLLSDNVMLSKNYVFLLCYSRDSNNDNDIIRIILFG